MDNPSRSARQNLLLGAAVGALTTATTFYFLGFERKSKNETVIAESDKASTESDSKLVVVANDGDARRYAVPSQVVVIDQVFESVIPMVEEERRKPVKYDNFVISKESQANYTNLISPHDVVLGEIVRKSGTRPFITGYIRAGPRRTLRFYPNEVRAAIVTCGGLCPGLNNVIREITRTLHFLYNAKVVYGVMGGYKGFGESGQILTPELVSSIHHLGGTILSSSRGGFDLDTIFNFVSKKKISQLFIIGGDGTHRGANAICQEATRRKAKVCVVGIPKTIDNDVAKIDRSFGFETAVEAAQAAIVSAKTEAACNRPNGVGIVKLMGRSTGFLAAYATMASGDVDLCLVPEVNIVLEGEKGVLPHVWNRVKANGHAVIVVAEGAGTEIIGETTGETDASGNKKLPPIGVLMKEKVMEYFEKNGSPATVKYIDPSYMIRSVAANSADSRYCMQLGQNAVHGAMAGFTNFTVGLINNRMVYLPIEEVVEASPRGMNPKGRSWERVLAITRQPNPC